MYPTSRFAGSPWMPGVVPPAMSQLRLPMIPPNVPPALLPRVPLGIPLPGAPATSGAAGIRPSMVPIPTSVGTAGLAGYPIQPTMLHHPGLGDPAIAHVTGPCIRLPQGPALPHGQVFHPMAMRQPNPFSVGGMPTFLPRPLTSMAYPSMNGGLMARPHMTYPMFRHLGPIPGMLPPRVQTASLAAPQGTPVISQQNQLRQSPSPQESQGQNSPNAVDSSLPKLSAAPSGTADSVVVSTESSPIEAYPQHPTSVNGTVAHVAPASISTTAVTAPVMFPTPALPRAPVPSSMVGPGYQAATNGIVGANVIGLPVNGVRYPVVGHPPPNMSHYSMPQSMAMNQIPVGHAAIAAAPGIAPSVNSNLGKRPSSESTNQPIGELAEGEPLMKRAKPLPPSVPVMIMKR